MYDLKLYSVFGSGFLIDNALSIGLDCVLKKSTGPVGVDVYTGRCALAEQEAWAVKASLVVKTTHYKNKAKTSVFKTKVKVSETKVKTFGFITNVNCYNSKLNKLTFSHSLKKSLFH